MNFNQFPIELRNLLDSETTDFIINSKRNHLKKKAVFALIIALFWNAIISVFVITFFAPLFNCKVVHFKVNDIPTIGSRGNWEPLLIPGLIFGLFVLIGIGLLIRSFDLYFQKGGYFAGTETRFVKYRNDTFSIKDWEQFSGNIKITNNGTLGDLELELRTGKLQNRKNRPDKFIPDIIYICEIENVFDLEKKIRRRIKQNDPTPSASKHIDI